MSVFSVQLHNERGTYPTSLATKPTLFALLPLAKPPATTVYRRRAGRASGHDVRSPLGQPGLCLPYSPQYQVIGRPHSIYSYCAALNLTAP
jgi:hypothetical protein